MHAKQSQRFIPHLLTAYCRPPAAYYLLNCFASSLISPRSLLPGLIVYLKRPFDQPASLPPIFAASTYPAFSCHTWNSSSFPAGKFLISNLPLSSETAT